VGNRRASSRHIEPHRRAPLDPPSAPEQAALLVHRPDRSRVHGLDAAEAVASEQYSGLRAPAAVAHFNRVLRLPLHHPPCRRLPHHQVRRPARRPAHCICSQLVAYALTYCTCHIINSMLRLKEFRRQISVLVLSLPWLAPQSSSTSARSRNALLAMKCLGGGAKDYRGGLVVCKLVCMLVHPPIILDYV
jgi:hypothetical protein